MQTSRRNNPVRVLYLTTQWPTADKPHRVPFVVRQVEYLRTAGIDIEVFHFRGQWSSLNYLRAIVAFREKIRQSEYDLIHVRFAQAGLVALMQRQLPIVVTYGGTDVLGRRTDSGRISAKGHLQRVLARFIARAVDANIVVSRELQQVLGVDAEIIPAGIDLERFAPMPRTEARQHLGLEPDKQIVLFLGDPNKSWNHKRYDIALAASTLAKEQLPNLEFLAIHNVPHTDIPIYMNAANVLLLTSQLEGSPNVVKEALACNLPVVSVDVGDVRERIGSIAGCVVCDDPSPETVASGLVTCLNSGIDRVDGRSAVAMLDEAMLARRTIEVYDRVLYNQKATGE